MPGVSNPQHTQNAQAKNDDLKIQDCRFFAWAFYIFTRLKTPSMASLLIFCILECNNSRNMKTKTAALLSLFFLSFHLIEAQEPWDLFPYSQRSYYEENENLKLRYNDSIQIIGNQRKHYLGAFYYGQSFGECSEEMYGDLEVLDDLQDVFDDIDSFPKIEEFYSENGIFSLPFGIDTLNFNVQAQIGDYWLQTVNANDNVDYFEITCAEIVCDTIHGLEDSVKTFTFQAFKDDIPIEIPINDFQWKLGKKIGLIEYFKPSTFLNSTSSPQLIHLIGFVHSNEYYGIVPSRKLVTQNYAIGNIYKWDYYGYYPAEYLFWHGEYVDSVTQIITSTNFFTVIVDRKGYKVMNGQFQYFTNENYYIFPFDMDEQWMIPPDWFRLDPDFGTIRRLSWSKIDSNYQFIYDFYEDPASGYVVHYPNCSVEYVNGFYAHWRSFRTDVGFDYQFQGSFYGSSEERNLIGYIIDQDTFGNVTPVSTSEPLLFKEPKKPKLLISPNPARELIQVQLLENELFNQTLHYRLYDIKGKVYFSERRDGTPQQFSVDNLAPGSYILTLQSKNVFISQIVTIAP